MPAPMGSNAAFNQAEVEGGPPQFPVQGSQYRNFALSSVAGPERWVGVCAFSAVARF